MNKLLPGAVFTDPAFLSVILSKTGKLISYNNFLNGLETEMEVLFPTGSRFRVIAVSDLPRGGKAVYLEELP